MVDTDALRPITRPAFLPHNLLWPLLKTTEPKKRFVGGKFGWARHRFPIKGGISFVETMRRDMATPPASLLNLMKRFEK